MNALLRPHPISSRIIFRLALGLMLLNLAWRVGRYLSNPPLWGDEAYLSVNFLVRDFAGLRLPLEYGQVAPIGYLWMVLGITRQLGPSEWALRLAPFMAGLLCVPLFWLLARQLLGRRSGLLAVAIFTASYYPARYASEAKPYMIDLFASLVITLAAMPVLRDPRSIARWALLTLLSCTAIWVSYPSAFIAGGAALAVGWVLLRAGNRAAVAAWLGYGVAILASFAAMYGMGARAQAAGTPWIFDIPMWTRAFPPLSEPWRLPLWLADVHTGEMFAYPVGGKHGTSTLWFALVCVGAVMLRRRRADAVVLLCSPLALTFAAAVMHRYPYGGSIRTTLYLAPAVCILEGLGLAAAFKRFLSRRTIPAAIRISVVVCVVIMIGGMGRDVVKPKQTPADYESRRVLRELAANSRPQDYWISFNALGEVVHAPNLLGCRGPGARMRYYLTTLAPSSVLWSPPPETVLLPAGGVTYLIVYRDDQVPFEESQLQDYVARLTARTEPPTVTQHRLDTQSTIDVYRFGP